MSTADQLQPPALPPRWTWKDTNGGFVAMSDDGVWVSYSPFTGNTLTILSTEDAGHTTGRTVTGFEVPAAVYEAVATYTAARFGVRG